MSLKYGWWNAGVTSLTLIRRYRVLGLGLRKGRRCAATLELKLRTVLLTSILEGDISRAKYIEVRLNAGITALRGCRTINV